jgi:DNA-binding transcriptional MerR regulator
MLIAEVCKATGLTKKAVEYYTEQGFIAPALLSNGYRDFSESDAEKLRKIRVLRLLDMNLPEIQEALSDFLEKCFIRRAQAQHGDPEGCRQEQAASAARLR